MSIFSKIWKDKDGGKQTNGNRRWNLKMQLSVLLSLDVELF